MVVERFLTLSGPVLTHMFEHEFDCMFTYDLPKTLSGPVRTSVYVPPPLLFRAPNEVEHQQIVHGLGQGSEQLRQSHYATLYSSNFAKLPPQSTLIQSGNSILKPALKTKLIWKSNQF